MRTLIIAFALVSVLVPYKASAQQSTDQQIERTAHRFGLGVQGGAGLDPELLDFGAHIFRGFHPEYLVPARD